MCVSSGVCVCVCMCVSSVCIHTQKHKTSTHIHIRIHINVHRERYIYTYIYQKCVYRHRSKTDRQTDRQIHTHMNTHTYIVPYEPTVYLVMMHELCTSSSRFGNRPAHGTRHALHTTNLPSSLNIWAITGILTSPVFFLFLVY